MSLDLDRRPIIVALAGPNGAGKTTFHRAHLRQSGLRFVNADQLAREMGLDPMRAAEVAGVVRQQLLDAGESFIFETVFSDPVGDKVSFLADAVKRDYTVLLCFIGLSSAEISEERVAMRLTQGGHDVPADKIVTRFPRILANLARAIERLPWVNVYDNDDLRQPYRLVGTFRDGKAERLDRPAPAWLSRMVPPPTSR